MSKSATSLLACLLLPMLVWGQSAADDPAPLLEKLGELPGVEHADSTLLWTQGARSFPIVAVVGDRPVLETAVGQIRAERAAFRNPEALETLDELLALASAAGLGSQPGSDSGFSLQASPLTGLRLAGPQQLVVSEGVLQRMPTAKNQAADEIARLNTALTALVAALPKSGIGPLAQQAAADFLELLPLPDGGRAIDEVEPSLARRLLRCGWLSGIPALAALEQAPELEQAVQAVCALRPVGVFAGPGISLVRMTDAWGSGGWVYKTPTQTAYAMPSALPMYHWPAQDSLGEAVVVVELGDELTGNGGSASLWHERRCLARWTAETGLEADQDLWREVVPARGRRLDANIVSDYMPPHIVVRNLQGDVIEILSEGGRLRPPADTSTEEARRFLANAAAVLPDAPAIDLIGQYLFAYVYDSPDNTLPTLIGNTRVKGEIHQDSFETLATAAGGVCRGDCDDLSELFASIAQLQGKLVQVISLPMHVAAAWAEEREGAWHTFVMQTGPTLEFVAPTLPASLEQAFRSFDESASFDANEIELTLRFSGENTRSSWLLGYRIFADVEYNRFMLDVCRDWHFQTYLQAFHKMQGLIASGNHDTANYRELSALASRTGQFALAVDYQDKVLERTDDPRSRLTMNLELIRYALEAEQNERAHTLARDILSQQLPTLRDRMSDIEVARLGLELADILADGDALELARDCLAETVLPFIDGLQPSIIRYVNGGNFDAARWQGELVLRDLLRSSAFAGLRMLDQLGSGALRDDPVLRRLAASAQVYVDQLLTVDAFGRADLLSRYAAAARFYETVLGEEELRTLVSQTDWPTAPDYDHRQRMGGLIQLPADLPWIKASVSYWYGALAGLFGEDHENIDGVLAGELFAQLQAAEVQARVLGLHSPNAESQLVLAGLITALAQQDAARLRSVLAEVKTRDDRSLREQCAGWLGLSARLLEIEWYDSVIAIWTEVLDYKPKYFLIAWQAAMNDAPQHALLVAERAVDRFPDDTAFIEELEFMRKLFAAPSP